MSPPGVFTSLSVQFIESPFALKELGRYGPSGALDTIGMDRVCSPNATLDLTINLLLSTYFFVLVFSAKNLIIDSILLLESSLLYDTVAGAEQLESISIVTVPWELVSNFFPKFTANSSMAL